MKPLSGILLVDKPAGVTSFDVVGYVRKQLRRSFPELAPARARRGQPHPGKFRCGHSGTLDPMATGLLVVLIGKGSRLSPYLTGMDKTYEARVRFGAVTDTLDREGQVTQTAPAPASAADVVDLLPRFTGTIEQVPPMISALKKDGQPLHRRVRAGEEVEAPAAREITISKLELRGVHWDLPARLGAQEEPGILGADGIVHEIDLLVDCSSGTYIRSLARDLGEAAGSLAHLHRLRRTRIGAHDVADALDGVMGCDGTELAAALLPLSAALPHLPYLTLSEQEAVLIRNGAQPEAAWLDRLSADPVPQRKSGALLQLQDDGGDLVAVAELDSATGEPRLATVIPAAPNPE